MDRGQNTGTHQKGSQQTKKAKIANKSVQLRNTPRFSVAETLCIKAVPTNQGIKEAFSTDPKTPSTPT